MKVRIGALEIEVETLEQLDELVMRYGGPTPRSIEYEKPPTTGGASNDPGSAGENPPQSKAK